ncbi:hypothetical protein VNO77_03916 [Canavalia gladiata]|uniref:Uncharacterized protein n=1 Tax=Canavalia gladiata TaxID=3824 RepID=A0AAN9MWF0_CANGL
MDAEGHGRLEARNRHVQHITNERKEDFKTSTHNLDASHSQFKTTVLDFVEEDDYLGRGQWTAKISRSTCLLDALAERGCERRWLR